MRRNFFNSPPGQILGILFLFTLLAFLFALGPYLLQNEDSPGPTNFWIHFHDYGIRYIPWGLLAPVVVFLVRRFPFARKDWPYSVVVHLASSISLAFIHLAIAVLINRILLAVGARDLPTISYTQFAASYLNMSLVSYWLIVAVVVNLDSYRRFRDREILTSQLEAELAKAQIQTLKAQIEPHFLFNTLHAISGLVYRDPKTADAMLARLGRLIRSNMEFSEGQEIPLERELDILRAYADIMLQRFGQRIKIEMDVAPETRRALAPSFLLQPLVENAIRHGISPKLGGGTIRISSRRDNDSLVVSVADDGVGFPLEPAGSNGGGLGLENIRKRLGLLYGTRQALSISNRPEGGAEIKISIPFRQASRETASGGPD
jgi:two-component system LytT family sensor kinase